MSKHPALKMSKARQQAWLNYADQDDFFEMLTMLTRLYAKKKYTPESGYRSGQLLADYPEYLVNKTKHKKFINNVPFMSSNDAPGSYTEELTKDETPMDEINRMIDEL